jgi:hypothetical protein
VTSTPAHGNRVITLVVLAALWSSAVGWGQSTADEVQVRWRELQAREATAVTYQVTQDYTLMVRDRPKRHFEWQLEKGPSGGKLHHVNYIICWNDKYRFTLSRKTASPDFTVSDVSLGLSREANEAFIASPVHGLSGYVIRPYTFLLADSVADLVSSGKLKITSVTPVAGEVLVKGVMKYTTHANTQAHYDLTIALHAGDCRLKHATAVSRDTDGSVLGTFTFRYSYLDSPHGPQIDRIDYTEGPVVPDGVFQFTSPTPLTAPPESYRLTHFNFPEPEGVVWDKRWSIPLYVWLLVGAGAFTVLALILTWLRNRRRAKAPTTATPPTGPQTGVTS